MNSFFKTVRDYEASLLQNGEGNVIGTRYDHPECHLHANQRDLRFMTHATSFEEVFRFILACFYTEV